MEEFFYFKEFETKEELDVYIGDAAFGLEEHPGICFGFHVTERSATDIEVELYFNALGPNFLQSMPNQKEPAYDESNVDPELSSYELYTERGFVYMQNLAANVVLKHSTQKPSASIAAVTIPFLYSDIEGDFFPLILNGLFSFFLQLIYIPFLYRTVNRVVSEKSTRARESMRMMGMSDFSYWLSWLLYWTVINLAISIIIWFLGTVNIFQKDHGDALFLFVFLFGQSLFGLLLVAQAIFSNPKNAASTTSGLYFFSSIVQALFITETSSYAQKVAVCWFIPTLSMINGSFSLCNNFAVGRVANWTLQYQNFAFIDSIWLLIVGGLNWLIFGLYLEYALPKEFGRRRHPLFFLTCLCEKRNREVTAESRADAEVNELANLDPKCYEQVPFEIQQKEKQNKVLKIGELEKVFDNGFKAVNGVNLKMYEDQIFVLLGHNGAGKTTTINMLTGLFAQTKGHAHLFGIDMFNDMASVRQLMGVCPQHDVLFELLTVEEHISIFYDLKGADPRLKKQEIEKLLKDLYLEDQRYKQAMQLSGGNKRKLSVAIALCGHSKFVLLDEPTSGLDLSARRQLWNMLKEEKKNRIIILTTHYMDEADILGDRIGIMKGGAVVALGSSIFLKSTFGAGYNLVVVKENADPNTKIMPFLHQHLGKNVKKQSEIQSEMTITIPNEYAPSFP